MVGSALWVSKGLNMISNIIREIPIAKNNIHAWQGSRKGVMHRAGGADRYEWKDIRDIWHSHLTFKKR